MVKTLSKRGKLAKMSLSVCSHNKIVLLVYPIRAELSFAISILFFPPPMHLSSLTKGKVLPFPNSMAEKGTKKCATRLKTKRFAPYRYRDTTHNFP